MNIDKEISKIAKSLIAEDMTKQYQTALRECNFAISELKDAILSHSKRQRSFKDSKQLIDDINKVKMNINQSTFFLRKKNVGMD